jgi:L-lactate dehydrogenase complex protein LldG
MDAAGVRYRAGVPAEPIPASFLRRIGRRHEASPPLPPLEARPRTPAELRPGEEPATRFAEELALVGGVCERVGEGEVADRVAAILAAEGCTQVAVADDLGLRGETIAQRVGAAPYAEVAADRERAGALDATVTGCAAAIAATGSIVASASAGRAAALIAPVHVCIVEPGGLLPGLVAFYEQMPSLAGGSMLALQSGPSRSADIEKTLILGVHGPRATYVLLVDDPGGVA